MDPTRVWTILIFGAGGLAADVLDLAVRTGRFEVRGFVVDQVRDHPRTHCDLPVYRWGEVRDASNRFGAVSAIGTPDRRPFIETAEAHGFVFHNVIDPSAQVFPSASIAVGGVVIGAGSIVAARASIERHVFLNRGASVGHHAVVEPFTSVGPRVAIGGFSRLCEEVQVGIGATIIDRICVGRRAVVAAGAVVTKDCPPGSKMIGVPARAR